METVDNDVLAIARADGQALDESAIVRQMVALIDEMSQDEVSSISTIRDVAECLQLLSQAWPQPSCSTGLDACNSTPGLPCNSGVPADISVVGERFEIRRMLGHGGFGVVLLAFDKRLEREVALKIPRPEILVSHNMRRRFLSEAQAAAALDHPNIVPIFDTGDIGPLWFITSRYVTGPTLAEWLRQHGSTLSSVSSAELIAVLADAVHHAHSRGVLHRDLKPANVLLEPYEQSGNGHLPFTPRLSDFGLARRLDEDQPFTQQESLVGTPRYMAPEQAACRHNDVGIQSDVYGLGVILYELLTGHPPHSGDTDVETLRRILDEPVPLVPLQQFRVPRDLQEICIKCLQKDISQRYDTAGALSSDLRKFLANEPITARPVSRSERLMRWCQRHPVQAALCVALSLVSIAGVAGIAWQWYRAERNFAQARMQSTRAEENLRHVELTFIDLAWVFNESEVWSGSDETFSVLLEDKLRRYADEMIPQYSNEQEIPRPIAAVLLAMNAKYSTLKGQSPDAEQNYRKSIDLWCDELRKSPDRAEISRALAITLFGYASHLVKSGKVAEGTGDFQLVQQMFATLDLPREDEVRAMETYAHLITNLGYARARRGKNEEAVKLHLIANPIWHDLAQRSSDPTFRVMEAASLVFLATYEHRPARDFAIALSKTQQARQMLEEAVCIDPSRQDWYFLLAATLRDEAHYSNRSQGPSRAIPLYQRSIDTYRELLKDQPANLPQKQVYGDVNLELAQVLFDARGPAAALLFYEACAETWNELRGEDALSKNNEGRLAMVYFRIGKINDQLDRPSAAIASFRHSVELATSLREQPNPPRKVTTALIESSIQLGDLLRDQGQLAEAADSLRRAVDLLTEQSHSRPNNLGFKEQLKTAQSKLAELHALLADE